MFERDPAAFNQSMQRGIERSLFDTEDRPRSALDRLHDRVPMSGAGTKRLQDQQIERSLKQFQTFFSRHSR